MALPSRAIHFVVLSALVTTLIAMDLCLVALEIVTLAGSPRAVHMDLANRETVAGLSPIIARRSGIPLFAPDVLGDRSWGAMRGSCPAAV
jgi:hypothetical protein